MVRTRIWGVLLAVFLVGACAHHVAAPADPVAPSGGTPLPTDSTAPLPDADSVDVSWVPPGPLGVRHPLPPPCASASTSLSPGVTTPPSPTSCETQAPPAVTYKAASDAWTAAFTSRDCAEIGALGAGATARLYTGLRFACTAAADNDPAKWEEAAQALAATETTSYCPDELARTLLTRLVDAHKRAPQARLRFVASTMAPLDACR